MNISKALTSLDNFVKENNQSFEKLYLEYKASLLSGNREIIRNILECIAKLDFARANQFLAQIDERPMNPKDLKQIKFDLQATLNKLMREIRLKVRALEETIEEGGSIDDINYINKNILSITQVSNKIELNETDVNESGLNEIGRNEYFDPETKNELKNFKKSINESFSKIVIKALRSIENYIDSDCIKEAEKGLSNIKKVKQDLTECDLSENAINMMDKVDAKRDTMADEIMKRDYSDIKNYVYNPPKIILDILSNLGKQSSKFKQAHVVILVKIQAAIESAITDVKNLPFNKTQEKIRDIIFELN